MLSFELRLFNSKLSTRHPPLYTIHPPVPLRVDATPPNSLLSSPYHE
jgi:hypothetical protein